VSLFTVFTHLYGRINVIEEENILVAASKQNVFIRCQSWVRMMTVSKDYWIFSEERVLVPYTFLGRYQL